MSRIDKLCLCSEEELDKIAAHALTRIRELDALYAQLRSLRPTHFPSAAFIVTHCANQDLIQLQQIDTKRAFALAKCLWPTIVIEVQSLEDEIAVRSVISDDQDVSVCVCVDRVVEH